MANVTVDRAFAYLERFAQVGRTHELATLQTLNNVDNLPARRTFLPHTQPGQLQVFNESLSTMVLLTGLVRRPLALSLHRQGQRKNWRQR